MNSRTQEIRRFREDGDGVSKINSYIHPSRDVLSAFIVTEVVLRAGKDQPEKHPLGERGIESKNPPSREE